MISLKFEHADGSVLLEEYLTSDSGAYFLYQPIEISTGSEKYAFDSKRKDSTRQISIDNITLEKSIELETFFIDTVLAMVESFILYEYSMYSQYTFDSTQYTFDSTEITFDSDHVIEQQGTYRFNQPQIEFSDMENYYSTSFELIEV